MRALLLAATAVCSLCIALAFPAFAVEPPSDEEAILLRDAPDLQQRIERMEGLLKPLLDRKNVRPLEIASAFSRDLAQNFGAHYSEPGFQAQLDRNEDGVLDERDFVEMAFETLNLSRKAALSPSIGVARCCVIPIKFPDVAPNPGHSSSYWQEMFFGQGTYTTRSFFVDVSGGLLDLQGNVLTNPAEPDGYWVADHEKFYYNFDNDLLGEILAKVDPYYDFSYYDADGNGEIDGVYFIYAGAVTGWGDFYWGWATYGDWIKDGTRIGPLMFVGEDLMTYRVAAHEFGHMMGLPDLYDYTFKSAGVGVWSLMGKGEAYLDAWCRYQLGWENVHELGMDVYNIPFSPRSEGGEVYRLWDMGTHGAQYFLVEKVAPTGYDYQLPGAGLIIWHVDETVSNNNNWQHKLVDVEEADGLDELDSAADWGDAGDLYWPGNNTTFNSASYPNSNSYSGEPTAVQVINITTDTADLLVGIPGNLPVDEIEPNNAWNDSGVIPVPEPNGIADGKLDVGMDVRDFWRFTVTKPSIVDVRLDSHNDGVDMSLAIKGPGGTGPIEVADTTWADEHIRTYVFIPGNHFIEVTIKRQAAYYDLYVSMDVLPDPGQVEIKSWPLLPGKIYDNTLTIPALRFEILNNAGAANLRGLNIYTQGSYPSGIQGVTLWRDNGDDVFGPGLDTKVAGPFPAGLSNRIVIDGINTGLSSYTVWFITIDVADITPGGQLGFSIQSYKDVKLSSGFVVYDNFPLESGLAEVVDAKMPLCYVAAGDFMMGSDPPNDPYYDPACDLNEETPYHKNRTGNYYISRYEVTNAQFAQFMAAGGYSNQSWWTPGGWNWRTSNNVTKPNKWNDPEYKIGDAYPTYPVGGVSWHECYAFTSYIGGRLPAETEWEKSGRGTDGRLYTYGNTWDPSKYAAWGVAPVGSFPQSDSLYGVADLEGNIFEWVYDSWEWGLYERYASGSFDPPGFYDYKMQRGYRFLVAGDCDEDYASRLPYRDTWPRSYRWTFLGFRVAFNPPA